jgi:hypothetical protein
MGARFLGPVPPGRHRGGTQLGSIVCRYDEVLVTLLGDIASTYVQIRTLETRLEFVQQNIDRSGGSPGSSGSCTSWAIRGRNGASSSRGVIMSSRWRAFWRRPKRLYRCWNRSYARPQPDVRLIGHAAAGSSAGISSRANSDGGGPGGRRHSGRSAAAAAGHPPRGTIGRGSGRADRNRGSGIVSQLRDHRSLGYSAPEFQNCSPIGLSMRGWDRAFSGTS